MHTRTRREEYLTIHATDAIVTVCGDIVGYIKSCKFEIRKKRKAEIEKSEKRKSILENFEVDTDR